jgi:microcystin degradation protein MlrC
MAWQTRASWVYEPEPLARSMRRAKELGERGGPVVMLDHYDNCSSGGTMDTTAVLREVLAAGLQDVAVFAIYDPACVETMAAAGVGAHVELALGGKLDLASLGRRGEPLQVSGRVERIVDGAYRNEGAMNRGERVDMGKTAVLDTGKVQIAVISKRVEPSDPACFKALGIDPGSKRYLLLKSRVHWRAGFGDIARQVVECAGVGVCTSDYAQLKFSRLGRAVYPIDRI